jgi:hypothetical protein
MGGYLAQAQNLSAFVATTRFITRRNKREAQVLARAIDFIVDQLGMAAVSKLDAMEILLRRLAAVLYAEKTGDWDTAKWFEEQPDGVVVEQAFFQEARKLARLNTVATGFPEARNEDASESLASTRRMQGTRVSRGFGNGPSRRLRAQDPNRVPLGNPPF